MPFRLLLGLHGLALLGMILHTSPAGEARLLGKYSWPWALGMAALAAAAAPASRLAALAASRLAKAMTRQRLLAALVAGAAALACFEVWMRTAMAPAERPHPFLQLEPVPSGPRLHVNADGFRGDELASPKPPGSVRIFVLGGSAVYANSVPFERTSCRLLERALRERLPGERVQVLNAGCSWYTSEHALLQYLFRVRDLEPDLVVVCHGINDLCRSFSPPDYARGPYRSDYGHYFGALSREVLDGRDPVHFQLIAWNWFRTHAAYTLSRRLHVTDTLFSDLTERLGRRPVEVRHFPSLSAFRRNLELLAAAAARDGVPVALATHPSIYRAGLGEAERNRLYFPTELCGDGLTYPTLESMEAGMRAFNGETEALGGLLDLPVLDLDAAIPKDLGHFLDDCHLTEAGNAAAAEALAGFLVARGLVRLAHAAPEPQP